MTPKILPLPEIGERRVYPDLGLYVHNLRAAQLDTAWRALPGAVSKQQSDHAQNRLEEYGPNAVAELMALGAAPDELARLDKMATNIRTMTHESLSGKSRVRVRRRSDQGDNLDVDRALRGDWDRAYETRVREVRTGSPFVHLVIPWDTPCGGDAFWGAAIGLSMADALETIGYRVRLTAITYTCWSNHIETTQVSLKDEDQAFILSDVSAIITNTLWATVGLGLVLLDPRSAGYGRATDECRAATTCRPKMIAAGEHNGSEFHINADLWTEAVAMNVCKQIIATLGQPKEDANASEQ